VLRNNPIGSILVSAFFLLALTACWFSVRYYFSVKQAQAMQIRFQTIEMTMANMQRLVNESIEYSKKNPDIDPILLKFRLKTPPAAPAPAAAPPAVRPSR
jgi:hypothetical protein